MAFNQTAVVVTRLRDPAGPRGRDVDFQDSIGLDGHRCGEVGMTDLPHLRLDQARGLRGTTEHPAAVDEGRHFDHIARLNRNLVRSLHADADGGRLQVEEMPTRRVADDATGSNPMPIAALGHEAGDPFQRHVGGVEGVGTRRLCDPEILSSHHQDVGHDELSAGRVTGGCDTRDRDQTVDERYRVGRQRLLRYGGTKPTGSGLQGEEPAHPVVTHLLQYAHCGDPLGIIDSAEEPLGIGDTCLRKLDVIVA